MKRLFSIALIMAVLLLVPSHTQLSAATTVVDPSSNVAVYIVPHADDEVLSFGVPILNDIRAGKKVYLVLISPGEDSIAREVVNGVADNETISPNYPPGKAVYCKWHKVYHKPEAEGYLHGHLTKAEFGQARIQEFFKAGAELGIPRTQLKTSIVPNGSFTYDSVKSVVAMYDRLFPNAQFKSFSSTDEHIEHALLGKILNDFYKQGRLSRKPMHYVSIQTDRFGTGTATDKEVPGYKLYLTDSTNKTKLTNAVNRVYKAWNPKAGAYGLGQHSVPAQFDSLLANPYTKVSNY
ncbi:PIG-L family deacetylase [Laceyella putida]|uniref:PIG-L family deacetylase n=1 Tax=Laceyella putida TaxID=110101 RepID=A0ABW2RJA7_9BACL